MSNKLFEKIYKESKLNENKIMDAIDIVGDYIVNAGDNIIDGPIGNAIENLCDKIANSKFGDFAENVTDKITNSKFGDFVDNIL